MSESKFPVRTLLFVSAGLNLLIVGAVVGVLVTGARLQRPVDRPMAPRAFMGAVPPAQERAVREKLAKTWAETGKERDAVRDTREALLAELNKPTFDQAAVLALLAKMREADSALAARNQEAVVAVLKDMNPEERRAAIGALIRAGVGRRLGPAGQGLGPGMMGAAPPAGAAGEQIRPRERLREWRERRREERAQELQQQEQSAPPPPQ